MATKILPATFQQNIHVFQKLNHLDEELRNIVIIDYESLSGRQHDLNNILACWFLRKYFHVIILVDHVNHLPKIYGKQICTVIQVSSQILRNVNQISDHIAAQIMMCFSNGLFQINRCRRAYYCISEDASFPSGFEFMQFTGREHVYCCVLRSVRDFICLQYYFKDDSHNPIVMNVFPVLKNDFPRDLTDNSGKLMFFVRGEVFFRKSVTTLWQVLKEFGDTHQLAVNVTTAFPSVDDEVNYC